MCLYEIRECYIPWQGGKVADSSTSSTSSTPDPKMGNDTLEMLVDSSRKKKERGKKKKTDGSKILSISSDINSQSATLLSTHQMKMGFYNINLGTELGQRLHTCHLIIVPLIPVFILLIQNMTSYMDNNKRISDLEEVRSQVSNAIDFARLTRMLQEERIAVALNYFIERRENLSEVADLDKFIKSDESDYLRNFKIADAFNQTDIALQEISYWPKLINDVSYLRSKLKFQIRHALFRTKIREKGKS